MIPNRLPKWLRVALVSGIALLACGAGLFGYRWYTRPTTLTIAVGSLDGEANQVTAALASKLAQSNAPVRLTIQPVAGAIEAAAAFSSGKVDLAVVRGDVGDLSQAQAVIIVARVVALLIAPPGSTVTDLADLKRAVIGVVAGETNQKLVKVLSDEYNLARANVTFKDLSLSDVRRALEAKEVRAVLVVVPLAERYLSLVRGLFPQGKGGGPVLMAVEAAGAIAERERAYESFDVPKGTLRGSPANPSDDVTTLRTSLYLVAQKKLDSDLMGDLAQSLMKARRDLLPEFPILAQIAEPDTGTDAYMPVHPGAAAFYNGSQLSFLDKWGNAIFLAPMIAGGLASVLAAAWKFLRAGDAPSPEEALDALYALGPRIRTTAQESELEDIEREIDRLLQTQRSRAAAGDDDAEGDVTAVNVAAHRLENLIHDRRLVLAAQHGSNSRT